MDEDLSTFPRWTHIIDGPTLENVQRRTREGRYKLTEFEKWWSDRYNFLESRGYRLRSRFRPGWTPQWLGTPIHPVYVKDSYGIRVSTALILTPKATRLDNVAVYRTQRS